MSGRKGADSHDETSKSRFCPFLGIGVVLKIVDILSTPFWNDFPSNKTHCQEAGDMQERPK
jgi:hypothetical protein